MFLRGSGGRNSVPAHSWEHRNLCHNLRRKCQWHLVSRGQRYSKYPTMHKGAPTTKNYPAQNVNNVKTNSVPSLTADSKENTNFSTLSPAVPKAKDQRKLKPQKSSDQTPPENPSEENMTHVEGTQGKKSDRAQMKGERVSVGKGKKNTQGRICSVPTKCEIGPVNAIYYHVEQPLRPKGSHMNMRFSPFSFLHQTGSSKSLLIRKKKNRVILNKMKQSGKAEQSTYEEQRLKNSPDKKTTPNTHPI